jgi:hypothetical protein
MWLEGSAPPVARLLVKFHVLYGKLLDMPLPTTEIRFSVNCNIHIALQFTKTYTSFSQ